MSPFCLTPKTIAHYCVCASLFLVPTPFLAIIQLSFGQQILYVTDELIMKLLFPDTNTNRWASNGVSKSGHVTSLDWTHNTILVLSNHLPVLDMLGRGYESHSQDVSPAVQGLGTGCTHQ